MKTQREIPAVFSRKISFMVFFSVLTTLQQKQKCCAAVAQINHGLF